MKPSASQRRTTSTNIMLQQFSVFENNFSEMIKTYIFPIIAVVATLFLLSGCKDENTYGSGVGAGFSKYMIDCYVNCDSIAMYWTEGDVIAISFRGDEIDINSDREKFLLIAKGNNDTTYNRELVRYCYTSINDSIFGISVKCNQDIDINHPSGTELNDLFVFKFMSVYDYIQNNYHGNYEELYEMPACDVKPSETRYIIGNYCLLNLTVPLAKEVSYKFDVSVKLSQKTLTNTIIWQ